MQRSIAFPIIGLILVLISATTIFHYYIQVDSLQGVFSARNIRQAEQIHFTIQSIINIETEKLEAIAHSLKESCILFQEISDHVVSEGNSETIHVDADSLSESYNVDLFVVIDRNGKILHQAHAPSAGDDEYADYWGVEEVLEGRSITTTSLSDEGWGIRVFVPVVLDGAVLGAIILGTVIDDEFAGQIAEATGAEISIGSMKGLVASSLPKRKREQTDFKTIILSLTENRQVSVEDAESRTARLYAPLWVVDEVFGFVAEIDRTKDVLLLKHNKNRILRLFSIVMLGSLLVGAGLTFYIIRPLKKLTAEAVEAVQEISGDNIQAEKGNEVSRLVFSVDRMIQKAMEHIEERKKAESELLKEKERLDITLRSIGDAVVTTDLNSNIQLFNQAAEQLTGWHQAEVVGKPLGEVFRTVDEANRNTSVNSVEMVLNEKAAVCPVRKSVYTGRDQTERVIHESGAPIRDEEGGIIGAVLVFRDITEQKKMEADRIKAHQLESLGTLAGGIAHDFNNILTAILGNASLATLFIDPENKAYENLNEIEKASKRAKELTQKLLTFSKGGAPIKQNAEMTELVRESAEFILSGLNTRCDFFLPEGLWSAYVDKGQISQAIQNVCLNAHEASRESDTIAIRAVNKVVSAEDNLPLRAGNYIQLSITDHGRGISPTDLPKIYDPYFSTKREGGGLGLSIVHSIVERHGGYVDVQSEVSKGTTFTLYLPAMRKEKVADKTREIPKTVPHEPRILFMDDEEMLRNVVTMMLRSMGYAIEVATNGEQAVQMFEKAHNTAKPFDVVILDLTVPGGMGGKRTIKKLLEIDPSVTAIVVSGYSNDPVMAEFKQYGFRASIKKPFDANQLKKTIDEVLG